MKKKLALFFTTGVSLKTWAGIGSLDREIKPYKELAKYLSEIYFFTYGDKKDLEYQKLLPQNIKIFPNRWKLPAKLYSFLMPLLYKKRLKAVDILKTNQMNGSWSAVITKWLFKKKLIVRCGYEWALSAQKEVSKKWREPLIYLIEKIAYRNANAIIVTSEADKNFIKKRYKISPEKINFIPNYIDTNLFKPITISKESKSLCFVGRLSEEKNLVNLLRAMEGIDIKLKLIGSGKLGKKLKNIAQNIKTQIEFIDNIPNNQLPQLLNRCEIFILPSLYEGCPKALLEAMSCGLPVIGTDTEGIKEIVKHEENGYLCKTDAKSIKEAIVNVLQNKELQEKMGENARKTILENFSLEKKLEKEIEIYESL